MKPAHVLAALLTIAMIFAIGTPDPIQEDYLEPSVANLKIADQLENAALSDPEGYQKFADKIIASVGDASTDSEAFSALGSTLADFTLPEDNREIESEYQASVIEICDSSDCPEFFNFALSNPTGNATEVLKNLAGNLPNTRGIGKAAQVVEAAGARGPNPDCTDGGTPDCRPKPVPSEGEEEEETGIDEPLPIDTSPPM